MYFSHISIIEIISDILKYEVSITNCIDSMSIKDEHVMKKAIKVAFIKTGKKFLTYGDFKFLLLDKELKRYPTKVKKTLYRAWEKQFKLGKKKWEYPFKQFSVYPSYIAQILNEMEKEGTIKKTKGKKYRLSTEFLIDAVRETDITFLKWQEPNEILQSGIVRLYGFDTIKSNLENEYGIELRKIIDRLQDATASLFELQYRIATKTFFGEINNRFKTEKVTLSNLFQIYSPFWGLFGEFEFGEDSSFNLSLNKNKISNLEFVGDIEDFFYEYMKDKPNQDELSNIVKKFVESISHTNRCILIHPLSFKLQQNIDDPKVTKTEKLLDKIDTNGFMDYLRFSQELQLGEMELLKKIRKLCDLNQNKWKNILPDMRLEFKMKNKKQL